MARVADDAHQVLSEYHDYAATAGASSPGEAAERTGAALDVHAARLATALTVVLAELARSRGVSLCRWCAHSWARLSCECEDGPGNAEPCPCNAARQLDAAEADQRDQSASRGVAAAVELAGAPKIRRAPGWRGLGVVQS